jgi:hypothetical protein
MSDLSVRPALPPLPATTEDLIARRRHKEVRSLIDDAEEVHQVLWEDQEYRKYFNAAYNDQAVEGSLDADDFMAVSMIRAKAREMGIQSVATAQIHKLTIALHRVAGRYEGLTRKERRAVVNGGRTTAPHEGISG